MIDYTFKKSFKSLLPLPAVMSPLPELSSHLIPLCYAIYSFVTLTRRPSAPVLSLVKEGKSSALSARSTASNVSVTG